MGSSALASGAKSKYYLTCRLTFTLDPTGAWLVGQLTRARHPKGEGQKARIDAVGGLTIGSGPGGAGNGHVFLLGGGRDPRCKLFQFGKIKAHGQTPRLIEGNFKKDDTVVV